MWDHHPDYGARKYRVKVTADTEYNPDTHQPVPVNENQTLRIENKRAIGSFFSIIFKHPVNSDALVFGNDYEHPIRDRLPPGFNAALRLVKWTLDPAMDGDAYADTPYRFSPALATLNQFRIGDKICRANEVPRLHNVVVEEVAEGAGIKVRSLAWFPAGQIPAV
ncbi:hypothetical protein PHISP_08320 [Aspergillus sp. HF37]|nr:hypothetical protein PHISP_08320 [Aspergillus sp. HF37]